MKKLNRKNVKVQKAHPTRILQFGGGNFMRAFFDWMIDHYNKVKGEDLGVLVVVSRMKSHYKSWNEQDGLYHVLTKGIVKGVTTNKAELIHSISNVISTESEWAEFIDSASDENIRFIVSNTTEAGIKFSAGDDKDDQPPKEFPAKLTLWLYERYNAFKGSKRHGCLILPLELIENNGGELKECVLRYAEHWALGDRFVDWLNEANTFYNTLVDRIVPGVAMDQKEEAWQRLGCEDALVTECEVFHFLAIEGPPELQKELPLDQVGLHVAFTDDLKPFKTRKVSILNGAHTSMVPVGILYGLKSVRESIEHEIVGEFIHQVIYKEIIPALELPVKDLKEFASDVVDRFRNPYVHHELMSIALNSVSKFRTRILPTMVKYENKFGHSPPLLTLSFAALIHFYKGKKFGGNICLNDDESVISFLQGCWEDYEDKILNFDQMSTKILAWEDAWGRDMKSLSGLHKDLSVYLAQIEEEGFETVLDRIIKRTVHH